MPWGAVLVLWVMAALLVGCGAREPAARDVLAPPVEEDRAMQTLRDLKADLPSGTVTYDLYLPPQRAPLVIVAHGFARSRGKMAHWGERLAAAGLATAVPQAASLTNHARNAQALRELIDHIAQTHPTADVQRVGMVGFSAGGLQTLLAAADPPVHVWVGLDPVLDGRYGDEQARKVNAQAYILRAEPGGWNMHGNITRIQQSLPNLRLALIVAGGVHIDPEWPTDWLVQMVCGRSAETRRQIFVEYTVAALRYELLGDTDAKQFLIAAPEDVRVRDVSALIH